MLDSAVFPGQQGGPLEHTVAAKAVAFRIAAGREFRERQQSALIGARVLADRLNAADVHGAAPADGHLRAADRNLWAFDSAPPATRHRRSDPHPYSGKDAPCRTSCCSERQEVTAYAGSWSIPRSRDQWCGGSSPVRRKTRPSAWPRGSSGRECR
ncbi:hypothetical protein [Micromonospora sp. DT227]|uniref:hypothetical protein n=1 Tax=Micromonospora sp. DT227 TaxID=3393433 RepID=UPI003CEE5DDD